MMLSRGYSVQPVVKKFHKLYSNQSKLVKTFANMIKGKKSFEGKDSKMQQVNKTGQQLES